MVDYLYDAESRWIGENVLSGSGVVENQERFVYDGNQIVLEFYKSGSGAVTSSHLSDRYLWGPAVDQILADEQMSPLPPGEGQGEGYDLTAAGVVSFPLTDNLGSVRDVARLSGTTASVVDHIIYNAYGKVTSESHPSDGCLFGFTGLPFDRPARRTSPQPGVTIRRQAGGTARIGFG